MAVNIVIPGEVLAGGRGHEKYAHLYVYPDVGAADDPKDRPTWLKKFSLVTGSISSAPLDLAGRMENLYDGIRKRGWLVALKSVGTDFGSILPTPKDQPLALYIHRTDRAYTSAEAQNVVRDVLRELNMNYSPTAAWLGEIYREVVKPTVQESGKTTRNILLIAGGAALIGLAVYGFARR